MKHPLIFCHAKAVARLIVNIIQSERDRQNSKNDKREYFKLAFTDENTLAITGMALR